MVRRLFAFVAASVAIMLMAMPVFAADLNNPTPIPWNSAEYNAECGEDEMDELDDQGIVLEEGDVVWHFVLTGGNADSRLTVDFSDDQYDATGLAPDKVTGGNAHWWVVTGETTLEGASTNNGDQLVLSHICVGGPPPIIPEAPLAILLPAVLLAVLGALFVVRRRQAMGVA